MRETLALVSDILGIVTGVMAILGVGGFLTWKKVSGFSSPIVDTVYSILINGYRLLFALAVALLFWIIGVVIGESVFWRFDSIVYGLTNLIYPQSAFSSYSEYASYVYPLQDKLAYGATYFFVITLILPVAFLICKCIVVGNIYPIRDALKGLSSFFTSRSK